MQEVIERHTYKVYNNKFSYLPLLCLTLFDVRFFRKKEKHVNKSMEVYLLVSLAKSTSDLPEDLNRCFEDFVSSRYSLFFN